MHLEGCFIETYHCEIKSRMNWQWGVYLLEQSYCLLMMLIWLFHHVAIT